MSGGGDRAFYSQRGREGSLYGGRVEGEPEGWRGDAHSAPGRGGAGTRRTVARVGQEAGRWGRVGQPGWTVAGAARPGRPGSRSSGVAVIVAGSSGGGSSPSSCSGAVSVTWGRLSAQRSAVTRWIVSSRSSASGVGERLHRSVGASGSRALLGLLPPEGSSGRERWAPMRTHPCGWLPRPLATRASP